MIKTWSIFNESNGDIKNILLEKLNEVREFFYQLEDLGIIKYSILVSGYEIGGSAYFDPKSTSKMGEVNAFIDYITPIVKYGLNKDIGFHNGKRIRNTPNERLLILLDIKLPGEPNEFGSNVIGREGIELFDDVKWYW
jgi:hypothetical protein